MYIWYFLHCSYLAWWYLLLVTHNEELLMAHYVRICGFLFHNITHFVCWLSTATSFGSLPCSTLRWTVRTAQLIFKKHLQDRCVYIHLPALLANIFYGTRTYDGLLLSIFAFLLSSIISYSAGVNSYRASPRCNVLWFIFNFYNS